MKKVLTILMMACITVSSASVFAVSTPAKTEAQTNTNVQIIEEGKVVAPQLFTGLVKQTDAGLMLETSNGSYPLEGLNLQEMIDKEVIITGVVKGEQENSVIFVVKATAKG